MNVLLFSKDPALFNEGAGRIGDARRRHAFYAARLRERHPGSEIRIVGYTTAREGYAIQDVAPGLRLYPTNSLWRGFFLLGALRRLWSVLGDGWRPDVVSVQTPWEEGVLGLLLSRILDSAFVAQLHFDLYSEDWRREHPLNGWRRWVAERILKRADVIRVVSEALRHKVMSECGVVSDVISVVPVGVDFTPAPKVERPAGRRPKVVLFVGRLVPPKNLELWLRVARDVAVQEPAVKFVIAGDGEERPTLERRARELGIEDRVEFVGAVTHTELPRLYASADVFLLTSNHEGFGRVVLEAQVSEVPVVSTKCAGPEDLISHGKTGLLLPRGDSAGLASAVLSVLSQSGMARDLVVAAKARAEAEFSLPRLTDRLIDTWARANDFRRGVTQ